MYSGKPCGDTCVSADYECNKNGSTTPAATKLGMGASTQGDEAAVARSLKGVEDEIRQIPGHEEASAIDENGKILFRVSGGESEVEFTVDQIRQMRGKVLTHNHPSWRYPPDDPRFEGRSFI
jgi:hypothetical protein